SVWVQISLLKGKEEKVVGAVLGFYLSWDPFRVNQIITKYVYELLEKDCNLQKISIPVDATESEPKSFIFMSEDALTNPQKLMVLIHGSGVVRAGQWARRLIINEDLDSGTQIPFIKRAVDEGYGVIVLNPNENYIEVEKQKTKQSSSDGTDEPSEKRERRDKVSKETKKRRDFYEKYRNPQKEKEMVQLFIRIYEIFVQLYQSFDTGILVYLVSLNFCHIIQCVTTICDNVPFISRFRK
ncbi:hypothetical protein STEG23_012728, partial [Scotinomys teguina]